ncbi:unnamed protein product [Caenorhabditis brenneri]
MNRSMIHTQSEPQTSFQSASQHMQQQPPHPHQNPHAQILSRIITASNQYLNNGGPGGGIDSSQFLNGGHQKFQFDFLPHLQGHPNHLMQNGGGLVGGNQQQQQQQVPRTNGNGTTTKKKKGQGPGRRPALDANGMPKERPFTCPRPECRKSFCRNDHLQRHMRIHTGQRLFQCRTCLRSFSRSDHLAKHERTHSADKPFSCHTCARRFHKHEEQKKHEEKCQHKAEEQANNANRQQLNLMGGAHNMYQNPMILNASMQSPNSSNLMMIPSTTTAQFSNKNNGNGQQAPNPLEIRSLIAQNH